MNYFAVLTLFGIMVAYVTSTVFTDCGSEYSEINFVEVTDCPDEEETCILKRGTNILLNINFTSKADFESIKTKVYGVILGIPLPFIGIQKDSCKAALSCPGEKYQEYLYIERIPIKNDYPSLDVIVVWKLFDENGNQVVCINIPSRIE